MNYYDYNNFIDKLVRIIPLKQYRDSFRNILGNTIKSYYRTEYLINVNNSKNQSEKDLIILWVGGELCGQIRKYIFGKYLEIKYNKKVKYDLNWYKYDGLDDNKKLNRNFALLNVFPDLDFEIATDDEIKIYIKAVLKLIYLLFIIFPILWKIIKNYICLEHQMTEIVF